MNLNDAAIALAASAGKSRLQVYRRRTVAIITTGDEIVDVESTPGLTQIRNSNSYSLRSRYEPPAESQGFCRLRRMNRNACEA